MKIKKTTFSTVLKDLYGEDGYQDHITVGREFWWNFPTDSDIFRATGEKWVKLVVTYVRSGCFFYKVVGREDIPERFCSLNSFLAATLILADIDPNKDFKWDDGTDMKLAQQRYRFDDERTVVNNWDNSPEGEVSDEEICQSKDGLTIMLMNDLDMGRVEPGDELM